MKDKLSLKSLELRRILQQEPEPCATWPKFYPEIVPPERALRYLVCERKTNMRGESNTVSQHPYAWESLTWSGIESDFQRLSEALTALAPVPERWKGSGFRAPERWIHS